MRKDPYCSNCGYSLRGLTESSKCPECGKPLVEVLMRDSMYQPRGYRYASKIRVFGWPIVSIAYGPSETERRGHARGIIAIGEIATGWIAIGAFARGIIAIGSLALGVCSFGGLAGGLLVLGGTAIGGAVAGGCVVGGFAVGGVAVGGVVNAGMPIGIYGKGPNGWLRHRISGTTRDPEAVNLFRRFDWLLGSPTAPISFVIVTWILTGTFVIGAILALAFLIGLFFSQKTEERPAAPPE